MTISIGTVLSLFQRYALLSLSHLVSWTEKEPSCMPAANKPPDGENAKDRTAWGVVTLARGARVDMSHILGKTNYSKSIEILTLPIPIYDLLHGSA